MAEIRRDQAIRLARDLYEKKKREGFDFSNGPCLSEEIVPDWCVDVVHVPRQPVDNRPENQCQWYRAGQVHHFVELDLDGNLVRAV
ncbi:MAG: hypothetical protein M1343_09465 [Chloroflexi bacterium]|nr:hypothetical protein [Chloroflexota bacterium]MDA8187227.1 hypothetical protein [Dehalococcoidales bacterium]